MRKDRYVSLHKKEEQLVLNTDCNDRGWAQYFVFDKKTSLGAEGIWLTDGWRTKDLDIGFLQPTNKSSEKIKAILETNHKRRTFERTKHLVGESSGRKNRDRSSTPQRVEDSEETMSAIPTGSAAPGERHRRIMTEAEKEERCRRKRGVSSQDTTPALTEDRTAQLQTSTPQQVVDMEAPIPPPQAPPAKQQRLIMPLQVKRW